MGYFKDLRTGCLLDFQWLENDITKLINRMRRKKFDPSSAELLKGYVGKAYDRVKNCTSNTIENMRILVHVGTSVRNRYARNFSDFLLRFGFVDQTLAGTYKAIDRVCEEIAHRAHEWDSYRGVVVSGGDPYSTDCDLGLVRMRATDIHRMWNWGILGHELGHIWVYRAFRGLRGSSLKFGSKKRVYAARIRVRPPSAEELLSSWLVEILADAFGTLTIGPCLLRAHAMVPVLWCFIEMERGRPLERELFEFFSTHPPDEIRYKIMCNILNDMGIRTVLPEYLKIENMINKKRISKKEKEILEERIKNVDEIYPLLWQIVKPKYESMKEKVKIFSEENWDRAQQIKQCLQGKTKKVPNNPMPSEVLNGILEIKSTVKNLEQEKNYTTKALQLL